MGRVTDNKAILELHKLLDALVLVHGIVVRDDAFAIHGGLLASSAVFSFRGFIMGPAQGRRQRNMVEPPRRKWMTDLG